LEKPALKDHGQEKVEPAASLIPAAMGIAGLILGFVTWRLGYAWSWAPYLVGAVAAGYPVAREGIRALLSGAGADINLLTSVAGVGAMALGEWAEAAAVLALFSVGEYLEERAGDKASRSIRDLMGLSPRMARVKREGGLAEIPADKVEVGDTVVVFPGERLPADGDVVSGESAVDEASITGEAAPADKVRGDQVFAGSINGEGALEVVATRTAEDTTLSRIVSMVEEARATRARSQRLVDSFARYWTPAMIALSVAVGFVAPLVLRSPFKPWVYRGLTVLIVSCPCSLVISTPVTVAAAIATAAKSGVLIKGGVHLEDLGRLRAVAFDKTGTITEGRIVVEGVTASPSVMVAAVTGTAPGTGDDSSGGANGWRGDVTVEEERSSGGNPGPDDVLRLAASVEAKSEHPLARAIVEAAAKRGIAFEPGEHFVSIRGKGAKARVGGRNVYAGSDLLFQEAGMSIPDALREQARVARQHGKTAIYVGTGNAALGLITLSDAVRSESRAALQALSDKGILVTMLTGDDEETARAVASAAGAPSYRARLLPGDKQGAVADLKERFGAVAMVGDGVNDAPSLAAADVGIAMGRGVDVALETAGVVLLTNDLRKVSWSIGLGRRARALILENVGISLGLKVAALALVLAGILPLWLAVLADSGAAVLVTLNGLRVLEYRI
jgi:Cd2+/Zn2+-exporting ATPase